MYNISKLSRARVLWIEVSSDVEREIIGRLVSYMVSLLLKRAVVDLVSSCFDIVMQ